MGESADFIHAKGRACPLDTVCTSKDRIEQFTIVLGTIQLQQGTFHMLQMFGCFDIECRSKPTNVYLHLVHNATRFRIGPSS